MLALQTKMSKELKVKVPEHIIADFVHIKRKELKQKIEIKSKFN